ncbi:hypothetical protein [Streptomyces sp. NPDC007172]|uniref:hypothetical protein n=1 Tax=Streptomyces sp. NPDC007172 TaxID=3364776 RepID=UPI0036A7C9E7
MLPIAYGDSRLSFWPRVREFAVPPSMIETAGSRRSVGDWAGACAAAGFDVDLDLRSLARTHGRVLAGQVRADLKQLVPDLLRWHMPRIAPDGLLRPGLTIALARYGGTGRADPDPVHLVVRTPPAWADGGQRISLTLWGDHLLGVPGRGAAGRAPSHPHPHPHPRYRLDLHRHLWDARRTGELRERAGADGTDGPAGSEPCPADGSPVTDPEVQTAVPPGTRCATGRWADEARLLLGSRGRSAGPVSVRLAAGHRLDLELVVDPYGLRPPTLRLAAGPPDSGGPAPLVLPDAATWVLPDLDLIRAGAIEAGSLHPLVASALVPDPGSRPARAAERRGRAGGPRVVECRGERHRVGLVDGVLVPLDHDPAEIRREELLFALNGTPLPCLRAIDEAHRRPGCLVGVRERLDHGDISGALAVVEQLLGPDAALRDGPLRDELEAAARRRVAYGLYRAGLMGPGPDRLPPRSPRPRDLRSRPRSTQGR